MVVLGFFFILNAYEYLIPRHYVPLRGRNPSFEVPSLKDALCQVWLKFG